ncbi:hypothetical protein ACTGJZ_005021 [Escherichia coli]
MDDLDIQKLLNQVRILEQTAAEKTGCERRALQKRAAEIKMEIIKLLPQRGQQQEQGNKIPSPDEYFGAKLPEGFEENYFNGDYLTDEQRSYFDNLTDEQRSYFAVPDIQNFTNAPDAPKQQPAKAKDDSEDELRRRIFAALGIFY